jgi:hypothetical protein
MPSVECIRSLFYYDIELGCLRFRSGVKAGSIAGASHPCGYRQVWIGGDRFLLHRLIWKYHHGSEPRQVDHIDGNRGNSKIENLRPACEKTNQRNRGKQGNNTSGLKGAYFRKSDGRWMSAIRVGGKQKHLGYYPSANEAHKAYCVAAAEYYGEYANYGRGND